MRIALVKPDWGMVGGAELVVDVFERHLTEQGHALDRRLVDARRLGAAAFGVRPPEAVRAAAPEFFRHLALLEAFEALDLDGYDLVLSAQPPAYAVRHPRQLSLFFHHARIFYDLADTYVAGGWVDPVVHEAACAYVRTVENRVFPGVVRFLANSEHVKGRLRHHNGLDEQVGVFHGGIGQPESLAGGVATSDRAHVLCVSRNEFTKRTELFVHAMKYLPKERGVQVGAGGRVPWVRHLDAELSRPGCDLDAWGPEDLWLRNDDWGELREPGRSNVRFAGRVSDEELVELYATALCVVAPAYLEDYGMTALEAMRYGRPAVVCRDGGGLVDLVEHEVTGLVVEPTGRAIAEAVDRLRCDDGLWRELAANAAARADEFRWSRATAELDEAIEQVLSA